MPYHGSDRYNAVARVLHWTIAVLLIGNLIGGLLHDALEDVVRIMPTHKAVGITVLALSIARLGWRIVSRTPPLPRDLPKWEIGAAHAAHTVLYILMIGLPLSGWIFSSAGKYPLSWFGLFDIPKFAVTKEDAIYGIAHEGHEVMAFVAIGLIVLHIGAALRHHFVLQDSVLRRML
ncbi:cytochrome B561 [Croceicoccus naphthovorans]|uniref:Cytochrome B561 n=1 Tax=Croceicoccus naphthovorans TaxID=1348774 RepID=A0A0G3XMU2_9SPHN|nr:cytochrome B561 [Croceicoccus naphthovorans]